MFLPDDYLSDLMVRMAHHSTAIEGNSLTQGETKSILIDNYIPRALNMRELYEVLNYKSFMPFLQEHIAVHAPLTLELIREIHALLCQNAIESVPGEFKKRPNMIIGANFTPVPPYMVPPALADWIANLEAQMAAAQNEHEKITAICRQHIAFERIHPFPDGNGRTGRALMVYACLLNDMLPIVIPVDQRQEYINFLNTENLPAFTDFAQKLLAAEKERFACFN